MEMCRINPENNLTVTFINHIAKNRTRHAYGCECSYAQSGGIFKYETGFFIENVPAHEKFYRKIIKTGIWVRNQAKKF